MTRRTDHLAAFLEIAWRSADGEPGHFEHMAELLRSMGVTVVFEHERVVDAFKLGQALHHDLVDAADRVLSRSDDRWGADVILTLDRLEGVA